MALVFLWIFQIVCLNTFYKVGRTKVLNNSLDSVYDSSVLKAVSYIKKVNEYLYK